jgi:hypothetical protein
MRSRPQRPDRVPPQQGPTLVRSAARHTVCEVFSDVAISELLHYHTVADMRAELAQ